MDVWSGGRLLCDCQCWSLDSDCKEEELAFAAIALNNFCDASRCLWPWISAWLGEVLESLGSPKSFSIPSGGYPQITLLLQYKPNVRNTHPVFPASADRTRG